MDDEIEFEDRCSRIDNREDRNIEHYIEEEAKSTLGSDTIALERKLREHKKELEWEEPDKHHRFDSESGRTAAFKRWNKEDGDEKNE